ncbi:hypothetical protein N9Y42_10405, partial [Mariniblastus sp.]|nr:hypothetical protein [Mariniblastus sp.]
MNHPSLSNSSISRASKLPLAALWFVGTFLLPLNFLFQSEVHWVLNETNLLATAQAINSSSAGFLLGFFVPPAVAVTAAYFLTTDRQVRIRLIIPPVAILLFFLLLSGVLYLMFSTMLNDW